MSEFKKKTKSKTVAPYKSTVIKKETPIKKQPVKLTVSEKMDKLVSEMKLIIENDRKELNTSSCASINKAISDLSRTSKNLKR